MEICLDTSILIDILRKYKPTIEILRGKKFRPVITTINVMELYMGEKEREKLDLFIHRFRKILPLDLYSARLAGRMYKILKKKGMQINIRDIAIGAICIKNNIPILTKDVDDFRRLEDFGLSILSLEDIKMI